MRRVLITMFAVFAAFTVSAQKVTFMPQWTPQSQFAGYYVAKEMGFYAQEGLDVDIVHIALASTESINDMLKSGRVQIVGQQLLQSVIARADGTPLVNILQLTQKSGLMCVAHDPVSEPEDLVGMKVGRWRQGYSEFCDIMELTKGISINWIPFVRGINLYVFGAVDAILCYSYSEYFQLAMALGDIPDENVIRFSDFGYIIPEDGLYTLDSYYKKNRDVVDKFVRASKKGWEYAREHRDKALEISWKYINEGHILTNAAIQKRMLDEYLNLQVNPKTGKVDYAPADEEEFSKIAESLINTGYVTRKVEYKEIYR